MLGRPSNFLMGQDQCDGLGWNDSTGDAGCRNGMRAEKKASGQQDGHFNALKLRCGHQLGDDVS